MAIELASEIAAIERHGYTVRPIGAGSDGVRKWAVHRPDPTTGSGYNPRSYFDRDGLVALATKQSKQEIRDAIVASQTNNNPYILIREDKVMAKKKTTADSERAAREAKTTKGVTKTTATTKAAKTTKAPAKQAAKATKAAKQTASKKQAEVQSDDPVVQMLAGYQDKTTTERMTAPNMVNIYKRIAASSYDSPVVNKDLNLYDKRQARELARLGLVSKEKIPAVGLAYFPNSK